MPSLSIQCFGSFQVKIAGKPPATFGTEKTRALLAYLVVESDRAHTRSSLAGLLWGDQPEERALHNVRQALSTLRKLLPDTPQGEPYFLFNGDMVQFNRSSSYWLDSQQFQHLIEESLRNYRHREKLGRIHINRLKKAVEIYQGSFLEHFQPDDSTLFEEWVLIKRESLAQLAVQALALIEAYHERRGEFRMAREAAEKIVELTPWDETAHAQVMRLFAVDGQWSAAQAQYQTLRRRLADQLDLQPSPETIRLYENIRSAAASGQPFPARYPPPRTNLRLPDLPFIGREKELDSLAELLANPGCRLITLLGIGGIGKSRLAMQLAHQQIGLFTDGVWLIHLTALTNSDQMVTALADALGIGLSASGDIKSQVTGYLRQKQTLLVFDDLEHIPDSSGFINELLEEVNDLVIVATSRQRLGLHNEWVFQLNGLEIPPDELAEMDASRYSAPSLFLASTRRLKHDFQIRTDDYRTLIEVCKLLEGLPLGIELAAAAVWNRTLPEIAHEIRNNLDFLSICCPDIPSRHRSLRAALDHSWKLLNAKQQTAVSRLSVFTNSFSSQAAKSVADISDTLLVELQDRSLVRQASSSRLEVPEPLRPYLAEHLHSSQDSADLVEIRYSEYFIDFLAAQTPALEGPQIQEALGVLIPELNHLRQAWRWAIENDRADLIARATRPFFQVLHLRSAFNEGIQAFDAAWQHWQGFPDQEALCTSLQARLAIFYQRTGETKKAQQLIEDGLQRATNLGLIEEQIFLATRLAHLMFKQGKKDLARQLAEEGLALSQKRQDWTGQQAAHFVLGNIACEEGAYQAARDHLKASLEAARRSASPLAILSPLNGLADLECHFEQYPTAISLFEECLQIARSLGSQYHTAIQLNNLGTVYHLQEKYEQARWYYQQSLEICGDIGDLDGQAIAYSNLGEIAFIEEDFETARAAYQQTLESGKKTGSAYTIGIALANLGDIALKTQDCSKARQYFSDCLQTARDCVLSDLIAKSVRGLGAVLLREGQAKAGAQAMAMVLANPASSPEDREQAKDSLNQFRLAPPEPPTLDEWLQSLA